MLVLISTIHTNILFKIKSLKLSKPLYQKTDKLKTPKFK
jgi:hypothetical protein